MFTAENLVSQKVAEKCVSARKKRIGAIYVMRTNTMSSRIAGSVEVLSRKAFGGSKVYIPVRFEAAQRLSVYNFAVSGPNLAVRVSVGFFSPELFVACDWCFPLASLKR